MKQLLSTCIFLFLFTTIGFAQKTPGPAEVAITDSICNCISNVDYAKITSEKSAEKVFVECIAKQPSLMVKFAEERKVSFSNQAAMRQLGEELGKNLLNTNCPGFMKLTMAMVEHSEGNDEELSGVTYGKLKRIETKDFNYLVVTDDENKEKNFIWLRHFPGSDNFMNNTGKLVGKKLKIDWQEIEVYIPAAKNYYKIKEITGVEVM
ncbi:MAG: hypothetical protein LPJ89_03265 [Hymenobacteraceae bacterium]|nr:hypothetical protein [Hymenobacteraceae bacterium]MDX5397018.1 hypothetical protein [Hymenobacteraceae bacterium]MDX5442782.1 hypothetical protein [Hymenobacteraceae bacterium]MDX5513092.1 hypothetical protein [Hymenobacteraceae bacterium]